MIPTYRIPCQDNLFKINIFQKTSLRFAKSIGSFIMILLIQKNNHNYYYFNQLSVSLYKVLKKHERNNYHEVVVFLILEI